MMKAREPTKACGEHLQDAKRVDGGLINGSDKFSLLNLG